MDDTNASEAMAAGGKEGSGEKLDRLVRILEIHVGLHRDLLEIMKAKQTAMVQAETDLLQDIAEAERTAISAISDSERLRIQATAEVGQALGFPGTGRPRLLDIVQVCDEAHRDDLLDLREDLRDVADAMERVNRLNRTLVLHSLEHVHLFLSMLKGTDPDAKIYTKGGGEGGQQESILVDRRI